MTGLSKTGRLQADVRRCPKVPALGCGARVDVVSPAAKSSALTGNLGPPDICGHLAQHLVRGVYALVGDVWDGRTQEPMPDLAAEPRRRSGGQGRAGRPCRRQPRRGDLDRSDDGAIIRASPEAGLRPGPGERRRRSGQGAYRGAARIRSSASTRSGRAIIGTPNVRHHS
jgi:hypothetical protein